MIFNEGAKVIQWRKESLINKWCWNKWIFMWGEKTSLGPYIIHKSELEMEYRLNGKAEMVTFFRRKYLCN